MTTARLLLIKMNCVRNMKMFAYPRKKVSLLFPQLHFSPSKRTKRNRSGINLYHENDVTEIHMLRFALAFALLSFWILWIARAISHQSNVLNSMQRMTVFLLTFFSIYISWGINMLRVNLWEYLLPHEINGNWMDSRFKLEMKYRSLNNATNSY